MEEKERSRQIARTDVIKSLNYEALETKREKTNLNTFAFFLFLAIIFCFVLLIAFAFLEYQS